MSRLDHVIRIIDNSWERSEKEAKRMWIRSVTNMIDILLKEALDNRAESRK